MSGAPDAAVPYLALLVATFALHVAFIGFVLGGSGYVAARLVRGGDDPLAAATRDWLPFVLGLAITAGVAPLLFVQLLYQPRFYTANLLLFVRWLAIVPALIAGFYALYLGKSATVAAWPRGRRLVIAAAALACFVFVAWSWIELHALAMVRDPAAWAAHYGRGDLRHRDPAIVPRLVAWLGLGAALWPSGLVAVAPTAVAAQRRRVAAIAIAGLVIAIGGAVVSDRVRDHLAVIDATEATRPWRYAAAVAAAGLAATWGAAALGRAVSRPLILVASAVLVIAVAGGREAARVEAIDPRFVTRLGHAQGQWLFVASLVVGGAAIGWCLRLARRARATPPR